MARKDIEIRVRAKDDASKQAKKISDALKALGDDATKASGGTGKVGSAISALTADLAKLQGRASGVSAISKIVAEMDRAAGSVERLERQLVTTNRGFDAVRGRSQELASASAALASRIASEEAAIAARNVDLKTATALQKENNKAVRDAERLQTALGGGKGSSVPKARRGVGVEAGAPVSSARDSFAAFLAPEMAATAAQQRQIAASVDGLSAGAKESKASLTALRAELEQVTQAQREFAKETTVAGNAALATRTELHQAQTALGAAKDKLTDANAAAGTFVNTQDDVAKAADRVEQQLREQIATIEVFQRLASKPLATGGTISDPTASERANQQTAAMQTAREELRLLQAEQARLDAAVRSGSGNITQQADAYDRVTRAVSLAEQAVRKLEIQQRRAEGQTAGGLASSGFAQWSKAQTSGAAGVAVAATNDRVAASVKGIAAATKDAAVAVSTFGSNTKTTLSFMQRMRGELLALTATYIGVNAAINRVSEAMLAQRKLETAENQLGVAFNGDTGRVAAEMQWLNEQADRLGYTFGTLATGYGKISVAAQSAGFSVADTRKLFVSIAEAARVNGSSIDEMNGVLRAFDQMLSKGKIQAEELRGQLGDRMTGAFKLFADALGVSTSQLDEMMKKGEVFADRDTMVKVAERLAVVYGGQLPAALAKSGFAMDMFQRNIEKINLLLAEGLADSVISASASFTQFVSSDEGQEFFRTIGEAAGQAIMVLAELPRHFDLIVVAAKAFLGIGLAMGIRSVYQSLSAGAAVWTAYSQATMAAAAQGQRLTLAQRTLTVSVQGASAALAAQQASLLAMGASGGTAGRATVMLAGSLGALRNVMLGMAAIARGMWAAIGGPVGIAIAAVSLVYMNWESDAQRATNALQEHERQLDLIRKGYQEAGKDAHNWANEVKGVTLAQATASARELRAAYDDAAESLEDFGRQGVAWYSDLIQAVPDDVRSVQAVQINELGKAFKAGSIDADTFEKALNDIALSPADEQLRDLALGMLDILNTSKDGAPSMRELSEEVAKAEASVRVMAGTATEADKALLLLPDAAGEVATAFSNTAPIDAYGAALDELKSKIPSLAEDMRRLKEQTELNSVAWKAFFEAVKTGDLGKIGDVWRLWSKGVGDQNKAALDGAVSGSLVDRIIGIESGGNPNAKNPNSTATGAGQFIESTWLAMFKKYFPARASEMTDAAMLELRKNADMSRQMVELYAQENGRFLQQFGVQINDANLYLAHFLGPQGAANLLRASPDAQTSSVLDAGQISANKSILEGKTAAEVVAWAERKVGISDQQVKINQTLLAQDEDAAKTAKDQADATAKRVAELDHEIAQQKLKNHGKEREAAIEDAIRQAKAENPALTAEELEAIRQKTAALWDQANATHAVEQSEERVSQLQALRSALLEQRDQAVTAGDQSQIVALDQQIAGVNVRLQEAIASAIAMWEAVGGAEAEGKIATLRTLQGSIDASKQKFGSFGLSLETWQGVFDSAVSGIVGAFDAMAQAIASGENAFKAFGTAVLQTLAQVLQQIAVAIIRMQILKMLSGMGGGIGEFATAALGGGGMIGHTGGVVGSKAIGSGNASVGVPAWVQGAFTYHTGGIAGLRADEVSATLKKGEEIVTEEDPRHRFNMGGEGASGGGARLKQVLAIGDDEIANAMAGAKGESVTLTQIKRNAPTIRRILGM